MNPQPDWLEPLARLEDFNGDSDAYIDHLFSLFTRDFITTRPQFKNVGVFHDRGDDGGKPRTFTHITTEEDRSTQQRVLCLRRCERIAWIRAIIEHADDPLVLVWTKEQATPKRKAVRTYLFLEQEDFLVILQEMKRGHFMITAIYVDNPNQKAKHLKAHRAFVRQNP
jgi:hypothetical protein